MADPTDSGAVAAVQIALRDGVRLRQQVLAEHAGAVVAAGEVLRAAVMRGGKVLVCGNGGSAADAQHIAAELVGRYVLERRALPAIALTTDTSALTAISNDYGYDRVFARQVEALGAPGDVLIAITTSGGSPNVLAAIAAARSRGMQVLALTGERGGELVAACDGGVAVPARNTARIQELHITIGHIWCELVDRAFVAEAAALPDASAAPGKLLTLAQAAAFRERCRARKQTVVWSNGVFDVLHVGHLASLRAARGFGDVLIVGVNSDASVRQLGKGPERPIFPVAERVEMLAALELVDAVVVFEQATPNEALAAIRPDVHVKGADYAPPHGKPVPEAELVRSWGGRVEFVPLVPGRSSTDTLARLLGG